MPDREQVRGGAFLSGCAGWGGERDQYEGREGEVTRKGGGREASALPLG